MVKLKDIEINKLAVNNLAEGYNCVKAVVTISREKLAKTNNEFVYITLVGQETPMYQFWNIPKKDKSVKPPKHCGNKRQYSMGFLAIEELPNDLVGLLMKLSNISDWETGEINVTVPDIAKRFKMNKRTLYRDLNLLVEKGALHNKDGKYIVNTKYATKGNKNKGAD